MSMFQSAELKLKRKRWRMIIRSVQRKLGKVSKQNHRRWYASNDRGFLNLALSLVDDDLQPLFIVSAREL